MLKQYDLLKKIVEALISTIEEKQNPNEATLKHNFFHHLKLQNKHYIITLEENLKKHINFNGRADYYLNDGSRSYRNDIVIEFKVNCKNTSLIKHDLDKLDKIRRLNRYIAPIFINMFTKELDFRDYLNKTKKLFYDTKAYAITISPKIKNFFVRDDLQIIERKMEGVSFIINNARFIETGLIPTKFNVIRLPNKGGMLKNIHLYPSGRKQYRERKNGFIDPTKYIIYCDPIKN